MNTMLKHQENYEELLNYIPKTEWEILYKQGLFIAQQTGLTINYSMKIFQKIKDIININKI